MLVTVWIIFGGRPRPWSGGLSQRGKGWQRGQGCHTSSPALWDCVSQRTLGGQARGKLNPVLAFETPLQSLRMVGTGVQVLVVQGRIAESSPEHH